MKQTVPPMHPAVPDLASDVRHGRLSRREFLRLATLLGVSVAAAHSLAGCANFLTAADGNLPAASAPKTRGGTLKIGTAIQPITHPALMDWQESANQVRQIAEYLTETGEDNLTRPWLLERWEADEAVKTWTLHLKRGIKFNNGQNLTADDIIFNIRQWLNPTLRSSMQSLLYYLSPNNVERIDDYTVRLHLQEPQIGLPEHLFHYPAVILPRTFAGDFIRQPIGTGPFELVEYTVGERVVLRRRPDYWQPGADGQPLPYLDELIYLALEPDERIAAMQGGLIDTLYLPRTADWQALKNVPNVEVHPVSTAQSPVLRMRVDRPPWDDERVRTALKLCQDRQKILDLSFYNQGDLGHDAHVAPVHPDYCPQDIPAYDPTHARALLTEAGYPDGLLVTLTTKNDQGEVEMARLLKELAAPGGFNLNLNIVEPARYWDQWTEVELGITMWAHRPLGTMALALGYTADEQGQPAPWNETRWVDPEFTALLRQAEQTLDVAARRQIMCRLETVMQQRGPVGISYWRKGWRIIRSSFKNVAAHPSGYDLFYNVWKES